jgi:hypothetical protein
MKRNRQDDCLSGTRLKRAGEHKMSVYESIMQSLTEAVDYQQGKIHARKIRLTIKQVDTFNNNDIKQI